MNKLNKDDVESWSSVTAEEIEDFGDEGDEARKLLLAPTVLELVDDIGGKAVLDAGCGTGYLSRKLAALGAKVTGLEPADSFFEYCLAREEQEKLGINYIKQDLSEFEAEEKFEVVVCNMVLMDIADWKPAVKNCIGVLKEGGLLVFSILHPCFQGSDREWQELGYVKVEEYFERKPQQNNHGKSYTRPIQDYVNFLIENGCEIVRLVEPRIDEMTADKDPVWERNYHVPQFLFLKAKKK